jgi:hypothetical protein
VLRYLVSLIIAVEQDWDAMRLIGLLSGDGVLLSWPSHLVDAYPRPAGEPDLTSSSTQLTIGSLEME